MSVASFFGLRVPATFPLLRIRTAVTLILFPNPLVSDSRVPAERLQAPSGSSFPANQKITNYKNSLKHPFVFFGFRPPGGRPGFVVSLVLISFGFFVSFSASSTRRVGRCFRNLPFARPVFALPINFDLQGAIEGRAKTVKGFGGPGRGTAF